MVMGTNGTPIFDYKTNSFSEEAKIAYEAFINQYPDNGHLMGFKGVFYISQ